MKLKSFRVLECFGFKDSDWVNFESKSKHNLFYVIGRNSSGKSTLLKALYSFGYGKEPRSVEGFENYTKIGQDPRLEATFEVTKKDINVENIIETVKEQLLRGKCNIPEELINSDERLVNFIGLIESSYAEFRKGITNEIKVSKLGDGKYIFIDNNDSYVKRLESFANEINNVFNAMQGDVRQFRVENSAYNLGFSAQDIENLIMLQFPSIYFFNREYDLDASLPNVITNEHLDNLGSQNAVTRTFIEFLGIDSLKEYLSSNDIEKQQELEKKFNEKISNFLNKLDYKLIQVLTRHNNSGLQITIKTDNKSSFFYNISDNTKFLFNYLLYAEYYEIGSDILLFDEPNNGFHATAQEDLTNYLKELSLSNCIVISTHSEYMIDNELLENVRRMSKDKEEHLLVLNNFKNGIAKKGEYLSLQPLAESIGLKYTNQLKINSKVVIVEGLSELYYIKALMKLSKKLELQNILPGRGDNSMLTIVPFVISQALSFKVVLDTNHKFDCSKELQNSFGVDKKAIYVVPGLNQKDDSGIEDIFSKSDFKKFVLKNELNTNGLKKFNNISNSNFVKTEKINKKTLAFDFLMKAENLKLEDFDTETKANITKLTNFVEKKETYISFK